MIVYISIGNSDDHLSQADWAQFWLDITAEVVSIGHTHGAWFSNSVSQWQNACWCVEYATDQDAAEARETAAGIGRKHHQDAITWDVVPRQEFI